MKNITLLDGAFGTALWNSAEARGIEKVPVWKYNIEHPELVAEITSKYINAGSGFVSANTFGANRLAVKRSSDYTVSEVVTAAVKLAREAAAGSSTKLALDMGPLSVLLEPYGDLEEEEAEYIYSEMVSAAMSVGVDAIICETFMDLEMMKAAVRTAKQSGVPVFAMMTFEKSGKTMMGNSVDNIIEGLAPLGVDAIGMNCSMGPVSALPIIRSFAEKTDIPIIYKPNAGLPVTGTDGAAASGTDAVRFATEVSPALEFVSYIGGCCGTDPDYIKEIAKLIK